MIELTPSQSTSSILLEVIVPMKRESGRRSNYSFLLDVI